MVQVCMSLTLHSCLMLRFSDFALLAAPLRTALTCSPFLRDSESKTRLRVLYGGATGMGRKRKRNSLDAGFRIISRASLLRDSICRPRLDKACVGFGHVQVLRPPPHCLVYCILYGA